ncbi:hypothetical protein BDL97_17G094500, partial [Sphagnum fallax]
LPYGDLGKINGYAPNNLTHGRNVWEAIKEKVSRDCFWLLCDDMDMVEGKENKSSFCGKLISDKKRFYWEALKSSLDLHEPSRIKKNLKFSWDNQKLGKEKIMAKLYRVYIANGLFKNQVT